jgi:hypothetical protein
MANQTSDKGLEGAIDRKERKTNKVLAINIGQWRLRHITHLVQKPRYVMAWGEADDNTTARHVFAVKLQAGSASGIGTDLSYRYLMSRRPDHRRFSPPFSLPLCLPA